MPLKHPDVFYNPTAIEDRGINPYLSKVRALSESSSRVLFGERLRDKQGMWRTSVFGRPTVDSQLVVEIGSYKGATLTHFARTFPDADWVGVDITFKRIALAGGKIADAGLNNAAMVMARASSEALPQIFAASELDGMMVFYPDPWSRLNQRHHRMVTQEFIDSVRPLLKSGGFFWFKTDQGDYFHEVLQYCQNAGFHSLTSSSQLSLFTPHLTPFEQRFQRLGEEAWEGCWVRE